MCAVSGDSMESESKSDIATILWSHYWNLKSNGEKGINQVTTEKCKMANLDKYYEGRGKCYHQRIKPSHGGLL